MNKFNSILVANRGEIAVRIINGAKALGYRTIAVYSEADAAAPHVRLADDAVLIGPPAVSDSYLSIENILNAAKKSGAQAIHPGYGFLSENASFARACKENKLVFIGPDAQSIDLMGNKAAAKRRMLLAAVPCVPGYEGEDQSDTALLAAADKIGFPIMVKAAAGGGGRGMRLVEDPKKLESALGAARTEALNGFGSDELILEKAILRPRHVEVQVFADNHGNVIHLGERDCSVQRRHQKVVEESPCPIMTPELRNAMGETAVEAARAIDYRGAGTVEFLLDEQNQFYFLEMNTRLQVEHPVTELVTGLDLVTMQIDVAQGRPLNINQDQVEIKGHAIEVRLYAEDPARQFLPKTGQISLWQAAVGPGIRIDAGIESGQEISPFYDPMLAKIVAWGENRETARLRLIGALKNTLLFGATSNRRFLIDALQHKTFAAGQGTTAFIDEEFSKKDLQIALLPLATAAMAAVLQFYLERQSSISKSLGVSHESLNWSSGGQLSTRYVYSLNKELEDFVVNPGPNDHYRVQNGEHTFEISVLNISENSAQLQCDDHRQQLYYLSPGTGELHISVEGQNYELRNEIAFARESPEHGGSGQVVAAMHGAVQDLFVAVGDKVKKGQALLVIEAMKMQHEIPAQIDGTVQTVSVEVGTQVAADTLLIEIKENE